MQKGIHFGNGLDYYEDLPWLVDRTINNRCRRSFSYCTSKGYN